MQKIRFIHTADLHLDTPFKGLSSLNSELANRLKQSSLKSYDRIIQLCVENQVDFLIIAGDIFDSDQHSLTAQLTFVEGLKKLSALKIQTYFVCGNHDPFSSWLPTLTLPDKVFRFSPDEVEKFAFEKKGQILADLYGISFPRKEIKRNLANLFKRRQPQAPVSIGVLHGTTGTPGKHENYAPFSKSDIEGKGFDYWALGHIHKSHVIKENQPAIVYPGNPQGRDFGETGERGCYLVEIEAGSKPVLQFLPTQQIRFEEIEVDLTGLETLNPMPEKILQTIKLVSGYNENTDLIIRVSLKGKTPLNNELNKPGVAMELAGFLNENIRNYTSTFVWIDRIRIETLPEISLDELKKSGDFPAEILKIIDMYQEESEKTKTIIEQFYDELPEISRYSGPLKLTAAEQKAMLEKAKWMLLDPFIERSQ